MEDDTLSLKELLSIDLTKVPEQESLQILDNNFAEFNLQMQQNSD